MTSCDFSREEPGFLSLATCLRWVVLAEMRKVSEVARSERGFLTAYQEANGRPSSLSCAWRNRRIAFCARHWAQIEARGKGALFESSGKYEGLPTRHALALVMWAWHPDPQALAKSQRLLKGL